MGMDERRKVPMPGNVRLVRSRGTPCFPAKFFGRRAFSRRGERQTGAAVSSCVCPMPSCYFFTGGRRFSHTFSIRFSDSVRPLRSVVDTMSAAHWKS